MSDKRQISDEAKLLIDSEPAKALELYCKILDEYPDDVNEWDVFFLVKAARKSPNIHSKQVIDSAEKFGSNERVSGLFSWYVFDHYVKGENAAQIKDNQDVLLKMTTICHQKDLNTDDSYPCPYTIAILQMLDALSENLFNTTGILEWLSRISPELLSKKAKTITVEKRGEIELASDLEKYYAYLTKALLKSGNFSQCLIACNTALEDLDTFHYNNDLWFKMRIAISYEKTGEFSKSETLFKELLESKAGGDKWFLYRDIAELYFEQKEYKKAWKFAIDATFYGNEPHFLINLYLLQAKILFKLERVSEGEVLAILIAAILKEQDWNNKDEYTRLFKFFEIDLESVQPVKTCYRNAEKFWLENKYGDIPLTEGEVVFVHNNGRFGKIKISDNSTYNFKKRDVKSRFRNLKEIEGAKVSFYPIAKNNGDNIAEIIKVLKMKSVEVSSEPLKGVVKNIVDFGLFIELPGHKDGLLHKNSLPNNFKTKFQNHFKEGQDIKVRITKQTEKGLQLELAD